MTDHEALGRWFTESTRTQLARYNERMADAAPYRNTPLWARLQHKAVREFEMTTARPTKLYWLAVTEIETIGEISEATDELLSQFDNERVV